MSVSSLSSFDRHWATLDAAQLPDVIRALGERYWDQLNRWGLIDIYRRSERAYYGLDDVGGWKQSAAVLFTGVDGENVYARVNHYRSIAQGILAMAGHERPSFTAKAVNDKTSALKAAPNATGLVAELWRRLGLELKQAEDDETALIYGSSFTHYWWDVHSGEPAPTPEQPARRAGETRGETVEPWRVIHDPTKTTDMEWAVVARDVSVWDQAARYPEHAEAIVNARGASSMQWPRSVWLSPGTAQLLDGPAEDMTVEWHVHHKPTAAVPQGLYAIVCADRVLWTGPALLEDGIPVVPMVPARRRGNGTPYSGMWDLLCLQELYDAGISALASAQDGYGGVNVLVPKDAGFVPEDFGSGRRMVEYEPVQGDPQGGRPTALQLYDLPSAVAEYPEIIQRLMETVSGVNSVARGEPDSNLKSGAALALVQSLAVQFNSWFQAARIQKRERGATVVYRITKRWMVSAQMTRIDGAGGEQYMRPATAEQLEDVSDIEMETGPALLNQPAGKMEIADKLLDRGIVKDGAEYIRILTTGRLEPMLKAPEAQLNTLSVEGDMLKEGKQPPVRQGQDHATHVREHQALLTVDMDPAAVQVIEAHCAEHYQMWSQMPQDLAALTGQTVMPPPPPMMAPDAPPPDAPPPKGDSGTKPPEPGRARPMGGEPPPGGPRMPINPLTNERAPAGPGAPPTPV